MVNFDFEQILIIAPYNKLTSYLDIYRLVSADYDMALARVTFNLITQRSLKKCSGIIFIDNMTTSTISPES